MSTQSSNTNDVPFLATDNLEYRHILGELLEALEQGDTGAVDRFGKRYPNYAPDLVEAALYAIPALQYTRIATTAEPDAAIETGIQATFERLGLAAAKNLMTARSDLGWSLGELGQRLLLPASLTLKLERGQIVTWSDRLTARVAEVFEATREYADALLRATAGSFRLEAAAFSAEGDPSVAQVAQRRQETADFEEALAREHLTPEQSAYWTEGQ